MLSTREIGLYSSNFCGLSTFGMMVMKDALVHLGQELNVWKLFTTLKKYRP